MIPANPTTITAASHAILKPDPLPPINNPPIKTAKVDKATIQAVK